MIFYRTSIGTYVKASGEKVITQSEYDKATIVYEKEFTVPVNKKVEEKITDVDAKGNTIILGTRIVDKLVTEKVEMEVPVQEFDEKGNLLLSKKTKKETIDRPVFKKETREIRYNPYDDGYTIISDDSVVISEEEFHNAILNLNRETNKEKDIDRKEANDILLSGRFLVNINGKGKKKVATVHYSKTTPEGTLIEYDEERGDINTDNIDIANKYADIVNNESIEKAIEWYKTL